MSVKCVTDMRSLSMAGAVHILDLAGGSGLPAIPLAQALPQAHITLTGAQCCRPTIERF